ncbi:MAG TPA: hypothetical protein DCG28_02000 [Lachnospiraceae bacterium]|nr:hypothetical protein [Lachnospiraceae bacterium]
MRYAVYKGKTGYYCYEFVEDMSRINGTDYEGTVTEDKLPVILDGNGGFYKFSIDDPDFVKFIESDKKYPLPVELMYFKNDKDFKLGWISPDGDTYSCDYTNHTKCAQALADKFFPDAKLPEVALGRAGWLKIIDSWDGIQRTHSQFVYSLSGKITKRQADKLFDLGLYKNEQVQRLIKECEDYW